MSLLALPNELLLIIAENLRFAKDAASFLLTCRRLASLLTPDLHHRATQPYSGLGALHWASSRGHKALIKLLVLQKHFDTNAPDAFLGQPPLHHSISPRVSFSVPKLLVDLGANVNYRTASGRDALHVAIRLGHMQTAQMLVEHGASVDTRDAAGHTALYIAAYVVSPGMVRLLLQRGAADVNMRNLDGRTALHCVMHQGYSAGFNRSSAALLELLLKSGADTSLRSNDGYTARDIAVMRGLHRVVGVLDNARGPDTITTVAAAVEHPAMLKV
ncbi:ankyrin repeat-containing domain protein [Morchella snyderi]|nr:ankyrin repeat-containing domain protein [Morchella snyderi]